MNEFLKNDLFLIIIVSVILSLQFLHIFALDNRISDLEKLHSSNYCSECGQLK